MASHLELYIIIYKQWIIINNINFKNSIYFYVSGNYLLVIVNPKSGVGKSREIFQRKIVPILNMADVDYDLHITCMQNDAR